MRPPRSTCELRRFALPKPIIDFFVLFVGVSVRLLLVSIVHNPCLNLILLVAQTLMSFFTMQHLGPEIQFLRN